MVLWTSKDCEEFGQIFSSWETTGVSIDSRSLVKGDLYIALKGEHQDGHQYVREALNKGAAACMVSSIPEGLCTDQLVLVNDTYEGLLTLARKARQRSKAKIIGVTGSAGKTSTKEALRLVLKDQGKTHASELSYNNQWGVPLSLARLPEDAAYGVFEIGMNHAGEIRSLSHLVRPHVSLITTVLPAHMEFFSSLEAIAEAKCEIFEGMDNHGIGIINRDHPLFELMLEKGKHLLKILSFGFHEDSTLRLLEVAKDAKSSNVVIQVDQRKISYRLPLPGDHWMMNSAAVMAVCYALNIDLRQAAASLLNLTAVKGRGNRQEIFTHGGSFVLLDESYNANPGSMVAAIKVLGLSQLSGRRIAVLGDMKELGEEAARYHKELAAELEREKIDLVFTCGDLMPHLYEALPEAMKGAHEENSAALLPHVLETVRPGDFVMVKGSNSSRMNLIVQGLKDIDVTLLEKAAGL